MHSNINITIQSNLGPGEDFREIMAIPDINAFKLVVLPDPSRPHQFDDEQVFTLLGDRNAISFSITELQSDPEKLISDIKIKLDDTWLRIRDRTYVRKTSILSVARNTSGVMIDLGSRIVALVVSLESDSQCEAEGFIQLSVSHTDLDKFWTIFKPSVSYIA